jgi:hypothetical protein
MNSIKNIQERFSLAGIPVAGLGYFRDYQNTRQVAVPDSEGEWQGVSLNEDYIGYIRAADRITYTQDGFIGCETRMYDVQQDCVLVLWHSRDQNQRQVIDLAFRALGDVLLQNMSTDRQRILADEVLPENDLGLIRIAFRIEYKYVGNSCPIDLCTGYFEPCFDNPSCPAPLPVDLCEQVAECLPDFISTDEGNALTLGQDGKLYVAESGGGGLDCNGVANCQVVQTLQQDVQSAQGTADWAAAAASAAQVTADSALSVANAAYPATNPSGFQTAGQVSSAIAAAAKLSINDVTRSASSGLVTLQILRTITIPANTMGSGIYDLIGRVGKATGAALSFFYYFGTTSADLTGCTLIATALTTANNQLYLQMARRIAVTGNTLYFLQATENSLTDSARSTNAENSLAYDPTVPNFLHVVITTGGNIAFNHSITSLCQR